MTALDAKSVNLLYDCFDPAGPKLKIVGSADIKSNGDVVVNEGASYVETERTYSRPIDVSVEMRQSDGKSPECGVVAVFPSSTARHSGYNAGIGWWGSHFGTGSPGPAKRGDTNSDTSYWHTVRISVLENGLVKYYIDGIHRHTDTSNEFTKGKIRLGNNCRQFTYRNLKVVESTFTLSGSSESCMNGAFMQYGTKNDAPYFVNSQGGVVQYENTEQDWGYKNLCGRKGCWTTGCGGHHRHWSVSDVKKIVNGMKWSNRAMVASGTVQTVLSGTGGTDPAWHLAPRGASKCDYGVVATRSQCEAAVQQLASREGVTPGRGLQAGSANQCGGRGWGLVPLGCSAQTGGDWAAHFSVGPAECAHDHYQLVCSGYDTSI